MTPGRASRSASVREIAGPGGDPLTLLLYDDPRTATCLLHVHGKGGDVLSGPPRWLPPLLPTVSHAAVNLRCRGLAWTRYDRPVVDLTQVGPDVEGGSWEDLDHSVAEVRASVEALRAAGFERIVLVGHSSGGFFSTIASDVLMPTDRLVLLSPVTSNRRALDWWFPDPERRAAVIADARDAVAEGRGRDLVTLDRWYWRISMAALVQRADEPEGVWQAALARCVAPTLIVGGTREPGASVWSEAVDLRGDINGVELSGADHFYVGAEQRVADVIGGFLGPGIVGPGIVGPGTGDEGQDEGREG